MSECIEFRESVTSDLASIEKLYPEAFPDEDLLPLVKQLLKETPIVLSLVAIIDKSLVGHVIFTTCSVDAGPDDPVALLGPLAVARAWQKRGIGRAIVHTGLDQLKDAGIAEVYVLGDPAYYGRLGFRPDVGVAPPYPLPAEWRDAWQSISLHGGEPPLRGKLCVPQPWRQPGLWSS